jgi:hypothetical protein
MDFPADRFTEADASRLVQYATFLTGTFDQDTAAIKSLLKGVVEQFDEYLTPQKNFTTPRSHSCCSCSSMRRWSSSMTDKR